MRREFAQALAEAQHDDTVRELLERTGNEPEYEGCPLTSLLALHLLALADTKQAVLDAPVRQAWISLKPLQKWQMRRMGMQSLHRQKILSLDGAEGDKHRKLVVHPYGALIMNARINPRFVLTLGAQSATRGIRVFAIGSNDGPARCYIMEQPDFSLEEDDESPAHPLNWYYKYVLLSRSFLANYLAKYAAVSIDEDSPFAGQPRVMSFYNPPVNHKNMVTSLDVYGEGSTAKVLRTGPGAPESAQAAEMTVDELETVVAELLAT